MANRGRPPKTETMIEKQKQREIKSLPEFTAFLQHIHNSIFTNTMDRKFGEYLIKAVLRKARF